MVVCQVAVALSLVRGADATYSPYMSGLICVFLATVRLDMSFDTFEILHENHAAYTLYHMPITFKTVAAVVHLIVVEVLLLAWRGTRGPCRRDV